MPKKVTFDNQKKGRSMIAEVADATSSLRCSLCNGEPVARSGDIVIDLYDYSDEIEEFLGDEYAWITLIAQSDKPALARAVAKEAPDTDGEDEDWRILNFMKNRFRDISQINDWLAAHEIPFRKFLDDTYISRELRVENGKGTAQAES